MRRTYLHTEIDPFLSLLYTSRILVPLTSATESLCKAITPYEVSLIKMAFRSHPAQQALKLEEHTCCSVVMCQTFFLPCHSSRTNFLFNCLWIVNLYLTYFWSQLYCRLSYSSSNLFLRVTAGNLTGIWKLQSTEHKQYLYTSIFCKCNIASCRIL